VRADSKRTRARILRAALTLLNERGVAEVTVRDVARRAGISHGNLCYHFSNTGELIDALYRELVAQSDASIARIPASRPSIELLYGLQATTFELMLKYRFLFLDFVAVFRARPRLKNELFLLKARRAREFAAFVAWVDEHGLLRRERYTGEREMLFRQYDLFTDFWLSQAEIMRRGSLAEAKDRYQRIAFSILIPHLSKRGLAQCIKLGLLMPLEETMGRNNS
jgi:AcrR family transcriptional regulator